MEKKILLLLLMVGFLAACSDLRRKSQETFPDWDAQRVDDGYPVLRPDPDDPEFMDPDFADSDFGDPDFKDPDFADSYFWDDDEEEDDGEESGDDIVYLRVERKAHFPGGIQNLKLYLDESLEYPEKALDEGIRGRVFVRFIVRRNGSIDDPKVLRSIDPLLDREAIRVVENMPDWIPARVHGKAVSSYFTVPVTFNLSGN
ncbi:MAG: energy transducer TonB [Paludibacteraceae bacterium]|nr:energy transducer TonB [Paludibacteraceae bacterium]